MNTILRCTCSGQGVLKPVFLAQGLPSQQCEACEGTFLSLAAYRDWHDRADADPPVLPATVIHGLLAVEDAAGVRACPRCARLMQRLRVSTEVPDFRIDRCSPCQVVWFDRGEWLAMVHNGLARRLDEVLSDGWQRQLQQDELRTLREAALRERFGEDRWQELNRFRSWIEVQPERDELLNLLRAGW